jgi:hypothetical protein
MTPPLVIWYHHRPWAEFFCQGHTADQLCEVARQLKVAGWPDGAGIEVRDAATDKIVPVRMKDRDTGVRFAVDTIGRARTGRANAPNDWCYPRRQYSPYHWMA